MYGFRNNGRNLLVPKFWPAVKICEICKSTDTGLLLNYHLFTFTTRLIIFASYVYALVLFMQCCITVLATFLGVCEHIIGKYRTVSIIGPPTPVSPFIRGFTLRRLCPLEGHSLHIFVIVCT
jgi:hypothetical protein